MQYNQSAFKCALKRAFKRLKSAFEKARMKWINRWNFLHACNALFSKSFAAAPCYEGFYHLKGQNTVKVADFKMGPPRGVGGCPRPGYTQ